MEYDQKEVARLISLTFDSNPKVRIATARKLAEINDPGATLAMLELASDRNKEVAKTANEGLAKMREHKPDMLPLTELFKGVDLSGGKKEEPEPKAMLEEEMKLKEKMLDPLQKEFEKSMGKEKAEQLKPKLFELAFMHKDKSTFQNLLTHVMNLYGAQKEEKHEEKEQKHEAPKHEAQKQEEPKKEDIGLAEAGFAEPSAEAAGLIGREAEDMTKDSLFTEEEKKVIEEGEPSIIKMAYDSMMISDDETLIEHQRDTLKKFLDHQVDVAFKLARRNFKEVKVTDISNIKDGWKNITTDYLLVKKVEHKQYDRTKNAREIYTRLTVVDPDGKEGIIYLFENRGSLIKEGMSIRLEKAKSKTFKFSGETVLTVDKRGKAYAVF
jgi:hypothetical protein